MPIQLYKQYFKNKSFLASCILSVMMLLASFAVNFYAGSYATEYASNAVTDVVLNNIPVFDVDGLFIYGTILFWIFVTIYCLLHPQRIPFTFKTISLFVLIRSVFVSLTHIGPFPTQIEISSNIVSKFSFGGDLFFSGHTGLPFLLALIFWDTKYLRVLFIASSILFGIVVLLGHLHYSIDVLAAFFITASIYRLAEIFFKNDLRILKNGLE